MNYRECAKFLREQDHILIVTHRDPDGDTAGSAAALCSALRRLGKEAWLLRNPGFTRKVLPYVEPYLAPEGFEPACRVSVDVATERMFPAGFSGAVQLCIDHHDTNSHYGEQELVRGEKSSCGEIVLDKLFLRQLKKRFPQVHVAVLVRGEEVLNDATLQDAEYAGLARENEVFSNGGPIAGTIYSMLPKEARNAIDRADVILAKGQGNYESVSGQANGFPKKQVFYAFLCKCELFTKRFNVAPLTGVLTRE